MTVTLSRREAPTAARTLGEVLREARLRSNRSLAEISTEVDLPAERVVAAEADRHDLDSAELAEMLGGYLPDSMEPSRFSYVDIDLSEGTIALASSWRPRPEQSAADLCVLRYLALFYWTNDLHQGADISIRQVDLGIVRGALQDHRSEVEAYVDHQLGGFTATIASHWPVAAVAALAGVAVIGALVIRAGAPAVTGTPSFDAVQGGAPADVQLDIGAGLTVEREVPIVVAPPPSPDTQIGIGITVERDPSDIPTAGSSPAEPGTQEGANE